jgi:hypothetical protein
MKLDHQTVVAVVDNDTRVRRAIFDGLTASGHDVRVFHSAEGLIVSGILRKIGSLILGGMRVSLAESEPLCWAALERPDLPTVFITKHHVRMCRLDQICQQSSTVIEECDPTERLTALWSFLGNSLHISPKSATTLVPWAEHASSLEA